MTDASALSPNEEHTAAVSDEALLARFQNPNRRPPATETLGFSMLRVDQAKMEIEVAFEGRREFTNPAGQVQGGFLCAMLDETMSVAGVIASNMTAFIPTLEMKTSFMRPALPGRLICIGRVAKWGKSIAFPRGGAYTTISGGVLGQGDLHRHAAALQEHQEAGARNEHGRPIASNRRALARVYPSRSSTAAFGQGEATDGSAAKSVHHGHPASPPHSL